MFEMQLCLETLAVLLLVASHSASSEISGSLSAMSTWRVAIVLGFLTLTSSDPSAKLVLQHAAQQQTAATQQCRSRMLRAF